MEVTITIEKTVDIDSLAYILKELRKRTINSEDGEIIETAIKVIRSLSETVEGSKMTTSVAVDHMSEICDELGLKYSIKAGNELLGTLKGEIVRLREEMKENEIKSDIGM